MTTATQDRRATPHAPSTGAPALADVLVIFGITGDLAKVMTFHSLYRLERRGLLSCPIVGVAVDEWSTDDLREHARAAIEGLYAKGSWGPAQGAEVLAGHGRWHEPWVAS